MLNKLLVRLESEQGQALVEYALILSLIALVAAFGLAVLGHKLDAVFTSFGSKF